VFVCMHVCVCVCVCHEASSWCLLADRGVVKGRQCTCVRTCKHTRKLSVPHVRSNAWRSKCIWHMAWTGHTQFKTCACVHWCVLMYDAAWFGISLLACVGSAHAPCKQPQARPTLDKLLRKRRSSPSPCFKKSSGPRSGRPCRGGSRSRRTFGPAAWNKKWLGWSARKMWRNSRSELLPSRCKRLIQLWCLVRFPEGRVQQRRPIAHYICLGLRIRTCKAGNKHSSATA